MGLLARLDRLAGRLTRRLGSTAVAASAESGSYHGQAVQLGAGEVADETADESNVEGDEISPEPGPDSR
jgi:hypothetical protein